MRAILVALFAVLTTSGCYQLGIGMGTCPYVDELPRIRVDEGEYVQDGDPNFSAIGSITDALVMVDRQANQASLTFIDDEGRTVKIDYAIASSSFIED